MKTVPMQHQVVAEQKLLANPIAFALGAEQGTGKTWMILNDAENQYNAGMITGLLVIAPKGVHINWIKREAPAHLSVTWEGLAWQANKTKQFLNKLDNLLIQANRLAIFTINIDALNTNVGFDTTLKFLKAHRSMMVIDESQRIKNIFAKRTQKALSLAGQSVSKRIASGTIVTQGPQDIFSQFTFLREGCLGTRSFRAFVAEYAVLLPPDSPLVIAAMRGRTGKIPQIIRRDFNGRPMYRNTDKLHHILEPLMFRVRKEDCLDLPQKIYKTIEFELDTQHMQSYRRLQSELRYEFGNDDIDTFTSLTIINKLRQAASGFIMHDGEAHLLEYGESRLSALKEVIEDYDGPIIIWAHYRAEIRLIAELLESMGEKFVLYYGETNNRMRDEAIDKFQNGEVRFFLSNPAAGGTGITLTAAETVVYYGNSPSLEHRIQSEDRCHRIGLDHHVVYIDLVALNTIDEKLSASLQAKEIVAKEIIDGVF
jgi:SNF2 family DNA or RNA helicase